MNPEIKEQWIEALLSGEYKQGKHSLRSFDDMFCCLGVLCDLAVKAGVIPEPEEAFDTCYSYLGSCSALPEAVVEWAGMKNGLKGDRAAHVGYGSYGRHGVLSLDNDTGKTFEEIAEIIRKNF